MRRWVEEVDPPVTTSLIMSSIDRNWVTTEGVFHSNVVWSLDVCLPSSQLLEPVGGGRGVIC